VIESEVCQRWLPLVFSSRKVPAIAVKIAPTITPREDTSRTIAANSFSLDAADDNMLPANIDRVNSLQCLVYVPVVAIQALLRQ
jgi:hypothetical protein